MGELIVYQLLSVSPSSVHPSTFSNISSETTGPIYKFHMKTPYDNLAKIYTICTGHITKMATMPIYGKNPLNIFISGIKRSMALALGLGM